MGEGPAPIWLLVAGEPSGDRLAAEVLSASRAQGRPWRFEGVAGLASRREGALPRWPPPDGAMGLWDVLPSIVRIRTIALEALADAGRYQGALLVDYHGLTLPLGRALRARGVPVVLLSAPQVWAWRPSRAPSLDRSADAIACLLDFEPPLLRALGVRRATVRFVGHPSAWRRPQRAPSPRALAVLPGSRPKELSRLLPPLRAAAERLTDGALFDRWRVAVPPERAGDPALSGVPYEASTSAALELLSEARAAMACSGTVALEAALLGVPTVVAWRGDPLTAWVGARALRTPWISLPNVLLDRPLHTELLQHEVTPDALARAVEASLAPARVREVEAAAESLGARLRVPEGFGPSVLSLMERAAGARAAR